MSRNRYMMLTVAITLASGGAARTQAKHEDEQQCKKLWQILLSSKWEERPSSLLKFVEGSPDSHLADDALLDAAYLYFDADKVGRSMEIVREIVGRLPKATSEPYDHIIVRGVSITSGREPFTEELRHAYEQHMRAWPSLTADWARLVGAEILVSQRQLGSGRNSQLFLLGPGTA